MSAPLWIRRAVSLIALPVGAELLLLGCHSAFIQATVVNGTGRPIPMFEMDYPSASFGSGNLQPGVPFHYRFKVLGQGSSRLLWTDAAQHEHSSQGPVLHEGEEGALTVVMGADSAVWDSKLGKAP